MRARLMLSLLLLLCLPGLHAAQCGGAEQQLEVVRVWLAAEQTSKADRVLDALQAAYPDCAEVTLYRARSLFLRGSMSDAETTLLRYVSAWPEDARGYAALAKLYLQQRQYPQAEADSILALDKNPREPEALAIRGQILGMKGQRDEGIAMLEKACQLEPDNAQADFQLGVLYVRAQRHDDAVERFDKSLKVFPENAQAWDYLALNLEPLGQYERAEEAYRKAESVNQEGRYFDGFLDYNYGRFLAKRNQLKAAKEHLDRAVELASEVRAVWYERAKVDVSMKEYQDARTDAEKAASLPDSGVILDLQVYALLQQIYQRLGERELAKKYADLSRSTHVPALEDGR